MKKGLFVMGFIFAMHFAKSQVVDTTVSFITACKIQPIKTKITDTTISVKLGIRYACDNLQTAANLHVCFLDVYNRVNNEFNYTLTGTEYRNWDGSSNYLFNLFAQKYSIVFVKL
jgi:hypothetical protein